MITCVEAVYEKGMIKLPRALPLPDNTPVRVTIQTEPLAGCKAKREAWLQQSEARLRETWDNADDEVFSALLTR